jgi:hypothetical protein
VPQRLMFDKEVLHSGDCLKTKESHSFRKPLVKISFLRKPKTKAISFLVLMLLVFIVMASCATQHKYKKYKPIPCPCEKENKR